MLKKSLSVSLALCFAFSICLVSAQPEAMQNNALVPSFELTARGGMDCDAGYGLIVGLAISAATPCSILCAAGAWYVLGYMALAGCS
jgi:hypothetical protein